MLKERWEELKEPLCQEALSCIEQREKTLVASAAVNFRIFPFSSKNKGGKVDEKKMKWAEAVAAMKAYILLRKENIDTFINKL